MTQLMLSVLPLAVAVCCTAVLAVDLILTFDHKKDPRP